MSALQAFFSNRPVFQHRPVVLRFCLCILPQQALAAAACSNRPPPTMTQRALPVFGAWRNTVGTLLDVFWPTMFHGPQFTGTCRNKLVWLHRA